MYNAEQPADQVKLCVLNRSENVWLVLLCSFKQMLFSQTSNAHSRYFPVSVKCV